MRVRVYLIVLLELLSTLLLTRCQYDLPLLAKNINGLTLLRTLLPHFVKIEIKKLIFNTNNVILKKYTNLLRFIKINTSY